MDSQDHGGLRDNSGQTTLGIRLFFRITTCGSFTVNFPTRNFYLKISLETPQEHSGKMILLTGIIFYQVLNNSDGDCRLHLRMWWFPI